ncbi:peroxisomal and mitochondrial division factor 2-like [Malus sylvestris]|nr:peroxisomal and mitochondrial division factor 2-like [Malus sylvestris]
MAEKTTVEIVAEAAEDFFDADQAAELGRKVEGLEWEKLELQRENKETKEKIQELMAEIEKLKSSEKETKERLREMELVIERTEEGKDVLESVANRAMELETEVVRLQHDLISAMAEGERERQAEMRGSSEERETSGGRRSWPPGGENEQYSLTD